MEFLDKSLIHRAGDAVSGCSLRKYEFEPSVNIAVGSVLIVRNNPDSFYLMLSQGCNGAYMSEWKKSIGGMLLSDLKKDRTDQYYRMEFDGLTCLLRTITDEEYSAYLDDSAISDYLYKADGLNIVFVKICPDNIEWSVRLNDYETFVTSADTDNDIDDDVVTRPMERTTLHSNSLFDD